MGIISEGLAAVLGPSQLAVLVCGAAKNHGAPGVVLSRDSIFWMLLVLVYPLVPLEIGAGAATLVIICSNMGMPTWLIAVTSIVSY